MVVAVIPKFQKARRGHGARRRESLRNAAARGAQRAVATKMLPPFPSCRSRQGDRHRGQDRQTRAGLPVQDWLRRTTRSRSPPRTRQEGRLIRRSQRSCQGRHRRTLKPFMSLFLGKSFPTWTDADRAPVTVSLIAIMTTGAVIGRRVFVNSRIRGANTIFSGAIRIRSRGRAPTVAAAWCSTRRAS